MRTRKKSWIKNCEDFASYFKVGNGFWKTGIATETFCNHHKDLVKNYSKNDHKSYNKTLQKWLSKTKYRVDIQIRGETPKYILDQRKKITEREISKKDTNKAKSKLDKNGKSAEDFSAEEDQEHIGDNFIGTPVKFWDGLKRQLFAPSHKEKDNRVITFTLAYLHDGKYIIFSQRSHKYSEKFMGYFDLEGFSEIIAFDLLADAPYQWDSNIIKTNKFPDITEIPGKVLEGQLLTDKSSIDISNELHNLELNKNLYMVRPTIIGGKLFIPESFPQPIEKKPKLDVNITDVSLFEKHLVFDEVKKFPNWKGVHLSLGHEPYTRYYIHKKTAYLIRKLDKMDLTFFFAGTKFGIPQILSTNDELSYAGLRYGKSVSEDEQMLGTYFNLDLSLNKGPLKGLQSSFTLWPKSSTTDEDDIATDIEAYRALFGYKYSFLLPVLGAIDITPTLGFWSFKATATNVAGTSSEFNESFAPTIGVKAGYSINILDFILSGYGRYSFGVASDSNISSGEIGADIAYRVSNIYSMRSTDPAIYGFVLYQNLEIVDDNVGGKITANGLVIGIGGGVVWE